MFYHSPIFSFFFFNDTATTEIYTLSLHDALPISGGRDDARRNQFRGHFAEGLHCAVAHLRDLHRSEEHTSELQSHSDLVCRLLLEKKKKKNKKNNKKKKTKKKKHNTNKKVPYNKT